MAGGGEEQTAVGLCRRKGFFLPPVEIGKGQSSEEGELAAAGAGYISRQAGRTPAVKRGGARQLFLRPSAASPTSGVPLDFPRRDGCQADIFSLDLGTGR